MKTPDKYRNQLENQTQSTLINLIIEFKNRTKKGLPINDLLNIEYFEIKQTPIVPITVSHKQKELKIIIQTYINQHCERFGITEFEITPEILFYELRKTTNESFIFNELSTFLNDNYKQLSSTVRKVKFHQSSDDGIKICSCYYFLDNIKLAIQGIPFLIKNNKTL